MRTRAARAKTFHHRMRKGTRIPPEHKDCRCSVVSMDFTWAEIMPAMLAALESRTVGPMAKAEIRRELLTLAAAVDAQRGKLPRTVIRGVAK